MHTMKKLTMAIFVALACTLAILPAAAFAAEPEAKIGTTTYATLQEALDAAKDGDTVTVLKDIELPEDTRLSVAPATPISFTLDLNQKMISHLYHTDDEITLGVDKPVTLTIANGTLVAGWDGVMDGDDAETATAIGVTCAEAPSVDLTVSNVKIFASNVAVGNSVSNSPNRNRITLKDVDIKSLEYGVYSYNSPADIIFESGSIVGNDDGCFYLYGCNLTVNGGDFRSSGYEVGYFSTGYDSDTGNDDKGCNVTINGGNFVCSSNDSPVFDIDGSEVTVNGGRFSNTAADSEEAAIKVHNESKVTLNGGIFESAGGCFDVEEADEYTVASEVVLGENRRSIFSDGTDNSDSYWDATYAEIIQDVVTTTFVADGNEVASLRAHNRGSLADDGKALPEAPAKPGYTFRCWSKAADGSADSFTADTVLDGDVTVYAIYDLNQATMNAAPELEVRGATIKTGEKLDLLSLVVSAVDAEDGDLADKVEVADDGGFDSAKPGEYTVTFRVSDKDGATITKTAVVKVVAESAKPAEKDPAAKPGATAKPAAGATSAATPQTGDATALGMCVAMALVGLGAVGMSVARRDW